MIARIVITRPEFSAGEAEAIVRMLGEGAERVHIRKPGADEADVEALVAAIPADLRSRLSIHDFAGVARRYGCGFHLNSRVPQRPEGIAGPLSRSCHSFSELALAEDVDYMFLSPVFDSISKPGYGSKFSTEELREAAGKGLINAKVYALGGVDPSRFGEVEALGFGGVALLGAAWQPVDRAKFRLQFITQGDGAEEIEREVRGALAGGCRWVQLRMKDAAEADIIAAAARVQPLCAAAGAVFLLDDHVELVETTHAHGVHLGKNDMPVDRARAILGPGYIVGATANTFDDISRNAALGASYIGLGPLRFTTTKKNLSPVLGYEGYADILGRCREAGIQLPVVAIGGITPADIAPLAECGVAGVAVSGAISKAEDPSAAAFEFIKILKHKIS